MAHCKSKKRKSKRKDWFVSPGFIMVIFFIVFMRLFIG